MSNIKAEILRQQIAQAHNFLNNTMAGLTQEQAHQTPEGKAHSIAANYAHILIQEDVVISKLKNQKPLIASSFVDKSGISDLPPVPTEHIPDWSEWSRHVQVNLSAAAGYGEAVFEQTNNYLTSLSDTELDVEIDPKFIAKRSLFAFINMVILSNCQWHTGEISALKGLQNLKGYAC